MDTVSSQVGRRGEREVLGGGVGRRVSGVDGTGGVGPSRFSPPFALARKPPFCDSRLKPDSLLDSATWSSFSRSRVLSCPVELVRANKLTHQNCNQQDSTDTKQS